MATHSQVAHRWAQDDAGARSVRGFNLFFDRSPAYAAHFPGATAAARDDEQVIYSHGYHFPIAAFQTAPDGSRVVLANFNEQYSASTRKHQTHVARAIPSKYLVFDVPLVSPRNAAGDVGRFHERNLEALLERAADTFAKSKRARINRPWLLERAAHWLDLARDYAAVFGLIAPTDEIDAVLTDLTARREEAARIYAAARAEREAARVAAQAAEREATREAFDAWQAGEAGARRPPSWATDEAGSVYVRRNGDALETSRGASVPWEHAVKAFRLIRAVRARGEAWASPPAAPVRVGHFHVDRIDAGGNMWAGCHFFAWSHMAALAEREGV